MPIRRLADCWLLPVLSCALIAPFGSFLAADAHGASPATFTAPGAADGDLFGTAVAVDADRFLIGASSTDLARDDVGAAYLFSASGDGPVALAATLTAEDGELSDAFGAAAAISGNSILIGAPRVMLGELNEGAAYLFERSGGQWREVARLTPSDGAGGDGFGDAVALAGDRALVGARFADLVGDDEGAAYVFERTADGWQEVDKLSAPEPSDRDQFGHAVALADELALVGAPRVDEPERDTGAVWAFAPDGEGWSLEKRLAPSAQGAYDRFGSALGAAAERVVVGAPEDIPEEAEGEVVTGTATLFTDPR